VATTVVIREIKSGSEATRILDALDEAVDLPSDKLSNGRRYTISGRPDMKRAGAVAELEAALDRISDTWPKHVAIRAIA
jgi:hypothetical protein